MDHYRPAKVVEEQICVMSHLRFPLSEDQQGIKKEVIDQGGENTSSVLSYKIWRITWKTGKKQMY